MVKLAIVADDITGANDTGVQFAKTGLRTIVFWEPRRVGEASEYEVVVVDTESRGDQKREAYGKAFAAAGALKNIGPTYFYKKIDSTMRGNIGPELDGMLDALRMSLAIVCPAYPRNRRVTLEGSLLIDGIPVNRTEIADDPIAPVTESYIPTLIREQTQRKVSHVPLNVVRKGPETVKTTVLQEYEEGTEILVLDATSDNDLETIVHAASSLGEKALLCGSAGLAEKVPRILGLLSNRGGVLVLAGTVSAVTSRQIEVLEKETHAKVLTIDPGEMFEGEECRHQEILRVRKMAKEALDDGKDVVIRWAGWNQETEKFRRRVPSSDIRGLSRIVLSTFSDIAIALVNTGLSGLILTGGDTAMTVINAINAWGFQILGELDAGVPVGTIVGGTCDGLRVVTKAGAFGDDHTLARAVQYLRETR